MDTGPRLCFCGCKRDETMTSQVRTVGKYTRHRHLCLCERCTDRMSTRHSQTDTSYVSRTTDAECCATSCPTRRNQPLGRSKPLEELGMLSQSQQDSRTRQQRLTSVNQPKRRDLNVVPAHFAMQWTSRATPSTRRAHLPPIKSCSKKTCMPPVQSHSVQVADESPDAGYQVFKRRRYGTYPSSQVRLSLRKEPSCVRYKSRVHAL